MLDEYIDNNISVGYDYGDSPFTVLYLDVTSKCNMNCAVCYNKEFNVPDVTPNDLEDLFKVIPKRTHLRFVGGEPTIHPQFFELVRMSRKHKNLLAVSSNGLMYSNDSFMRELSKPEHNNITCGYGITMNGGFTNHDAYRIIDNDENILDRKVRSFENLSRYGIKNISPSAIIIKGVNEHVIRDLVDRCVQLDNKYIQLRFRSEGQLGDYINDISYTTNDFVETLFPKYLSHIPNLYDNVTFDGKGDKCHSCCFDFRVSSNVSIRQVEFGSNGAVKCYKRGYVDFDRKKIYPFFEYQKLKTKYKEGL